MKVIINRRKYDTSTAEELAVDSYSNSRDFAYWEETLYRKANGEYFLYGEGGAASKYRECCGQNEWCGGARIVPLTIAEAMDWAEKHMDADRFESVFGTVTEDAQPVIVAVATVRMIGNSLGFVLTKELRDAGIDPNEHVRITIQRI